MYIKALKKKILFFELDFLLSNLKHFFLVCYNSLNSSEFAQCKEKNYNFKFKLIKKNVFFFYKDRIHYDFFFFSKIIFAYPITSSVNFFDFVFSFNPFKSLKVICLSYFNFFFSYDLILWISNFWSISMVIPFFLNYFVVFFFRSSFFKFLIFNT